MNKKKKRLVVLCALTSVILAFGIVGCADSKNNESPKLPETPTEVQKPTEDKKDELEQVETELKDPALQNASVFGADSPFAFYVGKGVVRSLFLNGEVFPSEQYSIKNGCLLILAESWNDLGEGSLEFRFEFENYETQTIVITVTDELQNYDLFSQENLELWQADTSSLDLSWNKESMSMTVEKLSNGYGLDSEKSFVSVNLDFLRIQREKGATCVLFDYKVSQESEGLRLYATTRNDFLVGSFASFVDEQDGGWNTATIDFSEMFATNENAGYFGIAVGGEKGDVVELKNWRIGTEEDRFAYRVKMYETDYGFSDLNVGNWELSSPHGMSISWNSYEGALQAKQITAEDSHFDSRYCAFFTSKYFLEFAEAAGYEGVTFKVRGDENFLNGDQRGIRVFSKKYVGLDASSIYPGTRGVTIYKDFKLEEGETEITVKINAKEFLALDESAPYFAMVVACKKGGNVYFSDLKLEKTLPIDPEDVVSEETAKWGFTEKNTENWIATNAGALYVAWDQEKRAMRVTTSNGSIGAIDGRQVAIYKDIAFLKEILQAGYRALSFTVTGDEIFNAYKNRGVRVFSKQNAGLDNSGIVDNPDQGLYVYKTFGTEIGVQSFTVTVNIEKFLSLNENAGYFGLVISSAGNGKVWLSDMQFETTAPVEPEETVSEETKKWGFTKENTSSWKATNASALYVEWDDGQKAMRVTTSNGSIGAIDGRQVAIYKDIAFLKEMQQEGYASFTFTVTGDEIFNAYENRGVRVFSKQNAGLDNSGIIDNPSQGLYVYGTFGTEKGVESFTVTVNIAQFLSLNENAGYFGLVISSAGNGKVWLSDMIFNK